MEEKNSIENKGTLSTAIIGGAIIAVLLILSTLWINHRSESDTTATIHSVSRIYLRELTDRREQVIQARLKLAVERLNSAAKVISANDLQSPTTLSEFLNRMKTACNVDQVILVDGNGNAFTPEGVVGLKEYPFATATFNESKIFTHDKQP